MIVVTPYSSLSADQSLRQRWLEIALIFLVFFVAAGVPVPSVNETHYLTKAKHYWNPDWCAGDLFLESADAHLTFYWTIGWLTKWFSLPAVAWLGRIIAWSALAWSWQRLSARIVPRRWIAVVTATLLVTLIEWCNFAGEWVVGGVEGKCFAYVFVFCGLTELAAGNWRRVWPLLGLASAFHVLVGGWSVVSAAGVWAFEPKASRPKLLAMFPSLLLGGILALPGIIPGLLLTADVALEIRDEANQIYVFERLPHHLAPHRLPTTEIIHRFARFGLLLILFAFVTRFHAGSDEATGLLLRRIQLFAWVSVAISLMGLVWEFATINSPALSASLLKYYWFRLADIAVPMAVSLSLGGILASLSRQSARSAKLIATMAVVLPACVMLGMSAQRWSSLTAIDSYETRQSLGWRDVCAWTREHTTPEDLFLIPRNSYTFRWYAERPVFFTWKDIPQDAASMVEWWDRYQEVYYGAVDEFGQMRGYGSLQELGAERLRELAKKHNIDYILTSEYPPLPLPVAYENPWYKVYDLRQSPRTE
ncbi:MAG: DUF6798 domain-containing protein [Bythopirellula sp.]|nr:DUF6798 domain-containing protein [Bythopirellula sp.]